jgi:hypothetical protein
VVRPLDDRDWAVRYGNDSGAFSDGVHEIRLSTADDAFAFPDSVGTVRVAGDAWVPRGVERGDEE